MVAPNTNLVRFSGLLNRTNWATTNVAVAKAAVGSPTGHCWRMLATGLDQSPYVQALAQTGIPEFKANTLFTAHVWFKAENWSDGPLMLWLGHGIPNAPGFPGAVLVFHPESISGETLNPVALPVAGMLPWSNITGGVEHLEEGWHRVWVRGISPNVGGANLLVELTTISTAQQGDIGSTVLLGGFSLVEGLSTEFVDTQDLPRGNSFLPTFDFPFHLVETHYPNTGTQVQFGNGYQFAAKASAPPQRTFTLEFKSLKWFLDPYTDTVDSIIEPQKNAGALVKFYEQVELSSPFYYLHPAFGKLRCRFRVGLTIPKSIEGGGGATNPVTVEFIEMP